MLAASISQLDPNGTCAKRAMRRNSAPTSPLIRPQDFVDVVKGDGGADVVLDMFGGDYVQKNLDVLKPDGRPSQISFLTGADLKLNLT